MKIDLSEIARGRRIVAVTALELSLLNKSARPERRSWLGRFLRRLRG